AVRLNRVDIVTVRPCRCAAQFHRKKMRPGPHAEPSAVHLKFPDDSHWSTALAARQRSAPYARHRCAPAIPPTPPGPVRWTRHSPQILACAPYLILRADLAG